MVVDAQSNIRVLVHWRDQTVFAGEDVKCTITFKNVAQDAEPAHSHQHQPSTHDRKHAAAQLSISSPRANRTRGTGSLNTPSRPPISNRGHRRSALSLSIPSTSSQNRSVPVQWPQGSGPDGGPPSGRPGHSHKRSLSIVSIGSAGGVDDHITRLENNASSSYVPKRGHNRASSLQISPQAFGGSGTTTTSALGAKPLPFSPCNAQNGYTNTSSRNIWPKTHQLTSSQLHQLFRQLCASTSGDRRRILAQPSPFTARISELHTRIPLPSSSSSSTISYCISK